MAACAIAIVAALARPAGGAPTPAGAAVVHGHFTAVHGIRMYYETRGRGPVLVLLHGGAGNGMQFERQIPDFEKRFRLVIPDMCAQGRTTDRPGPLGYHAMAEDVIALMDRLRVRRFDLMGWSDGGVTGIDIAIHHRGRIRHLVTFGANFSPDGLEATDRAWNDTATVAAFGDGMREGWTRLSPQAAHYREAMKKILHMWRSEPRFTPAELGSIRTRAMICAGEHDLIRREHTEALAHAIPGARLWIVPGASHGAMIEKPELVNPRVIEFLSH
jgi:pimeloyl-ACP methyl ester carboxylesterase